MLKKRERLSRARDIAATKRGRSRRNTDFVVHVRRRTDAANGVKASNSRATVVVSKNVAKKATERNRLKRQVRVALMELLKKQAVPVDIVISVRKAARGKTTTDLQASLATLLA